MDNELKVSEDLAESRIATAHDFFRRCVREWAGIDGAGEPGRVVSRLRLLAEVVHSNWS